MGRGFACSAVLAMLALPGCGVLGDIPSTGQRMFERRDYSIDPTAKFQDVDLSILVANPNAATDVEFDAIFRQHDEVVWAPHFTIFVPEDYASFSVWPMGAKLWEVSGRVSYVPTFYIHKYYNKDFAEYLSLRKYQQVHIRGTIRSDFENRPWIEVINISGSGGRVFDDDSLGSLLAGLKDSDDKKHGSAIRHLENALNGTLANAARLAAHLRLGWLFEWRASTTRKIEDWSRAEGHYGSALSIDGWSEAAQTGVRRCERAMQNGGVGGGPPEPGAATPETAPAVPPKNGGGASSEWQNRWQAEKDGRVKAEADAAAARKDADAAKSDAAKAMAGELAAKNDAQKAQAELEAAARKAVEAEQKAADAQKALTEAGDARAKAQAEFEAAAKKAVDAEQKAADAQKALTEAGDARAKAQAELDDLKKKMAEGGDAAKVAMDKCKELEGQVAKLDEQIKGLTTERDDWKKKAEAAPAAGGDEELKKQIAAKEEELKKSQEDLKKLTEERDELKKKLAEAPAGGGDAEGLKKQIAEHEQKIKELGETVESQKLVVKQYKEENDKLTKENEELKKKLEEKK